MEADVVISKIVPHYDYMGIFKITSPYDSTSTGILSVRGYVKSTPFASAIISLRPSVYIMTLTGAILVSILWSSNQAVKNFDVSFWKQIKDNIFLSLADILLKPKSVLPTSNMERLLHLLWVIPVFFLISMYNANLQTKYVFLTGSSIDCFKDLVSRPHYKIVLGLTSPSTYPFWNFLRKKRYRKLKRQLILLNSTYFLSTESKTIVARKMSKGNMVVIDTMNNLRYLTRLNPNETKFHFSNHHYFTQPLVLVANRNVSYQIMDQLNCRISRFVETYQLAPFKRRNDFVHYAFPSSDDDDNVKWRPLKVIDVVWFLIIYCIGESIAVLSFFIITISSIGRYNNWKLPRKFKRRIKHKRKVAKALKKNKQSF